MKLSGCTPKSRAAKISNFEWILVDKKRQQLFPVCFCIKPVTNAFNFLVVVFAESSNVDLFQLLLASFALGLGLPKRSEHQVQIVVKVAFFQSLPFIAIQPDAFAAMTMIDRKRQPASDQILDHAKAALGTVNR